MKYLLNSASAVALVAAHMSDGCPTVVVKTENGPVVVNESDYLADRKENGGKGEMKLASEAVTEAVTGDVVLPVAENVIVPPTPSAPDFTTNTAEPVPQQAVASTGAAVPTAPPPGSYVVAKIGKKFFITDAQGNKIEGVQQNVDGKGYDTDQEAWVAAAAAQPH